VSLEEAFKAAKENLWEKTDPARLAAQGGGIYCGQWGDSYDSSRILFTELIYRLSVDGDPVAFVPNRDQFWVTGTDNLAGLAAILKGGVQSHFKQGHPLSPDLYVLVDGPGACMSRQTGPSGTCGWRSRGKEMRSTTRGSRNF
jgi:hypothetical protein